MTQLGLTDEQLQFHFGFQENSKRSEREDISAAFENSLWALFQHENLLIFKPVDPKTTFPNAKNVVVHFYRTISFLDKAA